MSDILAEFLYDIFGLIFPGTIMITLMLMPGWLGFGYDIYGITNFCSLGWIAISLFFIGSYILGHIVKYFSVSSQKKLSKKFKFFSVKNYENQEVYDLLKEELKRRYNFQVQNKDEWYGMYKYSRILLRENGVKSLSYNYLAKYNMYRSFSFIFFLNGFINLFNLLFRYNNLILIGYIIISFVSCFVFYMEFKRHWTLCGDETIVSALCYLNMIDKIKLK